LKVGVGDTFAITLEGHRTAGFKWQIANAPQSAKHLVLLNERLDADPSRPGAPATHHFQFEALAPGEVLLTFEYRRPWEDGEAKSRHTVRVQIEPSQI
jgi:predicted secreted protein